MGKLVPGKVKMMTSQFGVMVLGIKIRAKILKFRAKKRFGWWGDGAVQKVCRTSHLSIFIPVELNNLGIYLKNKIYQNTNLHFIS